MRYLSIVALTILMFGCDGGKSFVKGQKVYSSSKGSIFLYRVSVPIDSAELSELHIDMVEYKKIRNEMPELFPIVDISGFIETDQFYKLKTANELGIIDGVQIASLKENYNTENRFYKVVINEDILIEDFDASPDVVDHRYKRIPGFFVSELDLASEPDLKYN